MILITGVSGLLGCNLVLAARKQADDVIAIYNDHPIQVPGVRCLKADLDEPGVVEDLLNEYRPDWVVHCAAITNVDWCQKHAQEANRFNAETSRRLAASVNGINGGLVYISTDSVFDGEAGDSFDEGHAPSPVNVYAESKLAGESAVQEELALSLIVRTNIYGWNAQEKTSLAEWMLNTLKLGQDLPAFEEVFFSPILVNDLSGLILDMMRKRLRGVYHVGSSQTCSKYEFAVQLANVFELDDELVRPVSVDDSALLAPRPKSTSLSVQKISCALGATMPDVKSGLEHFKRLRDSGFAAELKTLGGRIPSAQSKDR